MKIAARNTVRTALATLLLSVFLGTLLLKPAHMLLIHHHADSHCLNLHGHVISGEHEHFCHICDFEFCEFIPQEKTIIPTAYCFVSIEQTPQIRSCIIRQSSHLFQLRAPPVV